MLYVYDFLCLLSWQLESIIVHLVLNIMSYLALPMNCWKSQYRKRPCISRTFFHKIEAKNQGCGLSTDTSVFGVLKNLINIHKISTDVKK